MAVLEQNITASPEERAGKRALAFMDVNTFKNMYYSLHTETADRFVDQAKSPDDPNKLSPEQLSNSRSEAGEEQSNIMDQFSTPGALMIVYGPMHSIEVEKIFEQHAKDVLASINDPTINSSPTELLTERIYGYLDSIFDEFPEGLSEEEKKQRKHFEEMSNLMESHAQMEEEQMRREKWNESTHNFGGMKISGEDLQKVFDFLKDPANRAKVEDKMRQDGASEDTIKKGREEMDEYIRLKELQKKRDLTKAEQDKLKQIEQSEEFKKYAQSTAEIAQKYGIDLPSLKKPDEALKFSSAETKKGRLNEEMNAKIKLSQEESTDASKLDSDSVAEKPPTIETQIVVKNNTPVSPDSSMKSTWNVVDVRQAFQDNSKITNVTEPKPLASNIELIQENKAEVLEPAKTGDQKPPVQVAMNNTMAVGLGNSF